MGNIWIFHARLVLCTLYTRMTTHTTWTAWWR